MYQEQVSHYFQSPVEIVVIIMGQKKVDGCGKQLFYVTLQTTTLLIKSIWLEPYLSINPNLYYITVTLKTFNMAA